MSNFIPFNRSNSIMTLPGFGTLHSMLDDLFSNSIPAKATYPAAFKLDVVDGEDSYTINAELPGVAKEEVALTFSENGSLVISVKKEEQLEETKKNYLHRERHISSMSRRVYLAHAKPEDVKAKLNNGILTISVPKAKDADTPKSIDIE